MSPSCGNVLQSTISKYLNLDIKIPTDILKNGFKQEKNLHKEDDKADTELDIKSCVQTLQTLPRTVPLREAGGVAGAGRGGGQLCDRR